MVGSMVILSSAIRLIAPSSFKISTYIATSLNRGKFSNVTGESASNAAGMSAIALFFAPLI